jgi:3-phosphoshikimate 1-carboxyvinyltransferase
VSVITGDSSLRKRPMNRIIDPLRLMGADIKSSGGGFAPLEIHGTPLKPVTYQTPIASAQVKSCILLAGLSTSGKTSVIEPLLTRDHTERMLPCFGVPIERSGLRVSIRGKTDLQSTVLDIPGDISSAAFFMVAASVIPDSEIVIPNVGINPARTGILNCLNLMGAQIDIRNKRILHNEPRGDLHVRTGTLKGIRLSGEWIPKLIDEIPVLAVAATQAEGKTVIRNARELRFKETDRIHATVENLIRLGVTLDELEDGFIIHGPQKLQGAELDSFGDHRIAMAFSIAALLAEGETVIRDFQCVDISTG